MPEVTLYDLVSNTGALSPFAWRVRLALNYKRIAYKTHWLTFEEVEPHFKSIGAQPSGKRPDTGADLYTVPAVAIDGLATVDSERIAEYLDRTFPEAPALFPKGTRALQAAFIDLFTTSALRPAAQLFIPGIAEQLDPAGAQYFRATRSAWFGGVPLEEWAPLGSEKRDNAWKRAEEGWSRLAAIYQKSDGAWLTGAQPVYADLVVLATLITMSKAIPEDEWRALLGWHGGIWGRLWQAGERYMHAE
ncbi:hypothetical protein AURDEDRAFT_69764 [Auricularia subglabra TFB-10046 SS5]|nr:hypothetical protein AURDEDRAFT_69764 [Auricularia subglabra TFB-10046 SS5]